MPNLTPIAKIVVPKSPGGYILVETTWKGGRGIKNRREMSYEFRESDRALATRLVEAINAGVVFVNPVIKKNSQGVTYVSAECRVFGKYAHQSLRSLGF